MGLIIAIHVIACVSLICLILVQRGRGGGLVDSLQGLETVFGTKTSAFLTKTTSLMAIVFFCTCLSLALFSLQQGRSLLRNAPVPPPARNAANVIANATVKPAVEQPAQPAQSAPVAAPVQNTTSK